MNGIDEEQTGYLEITACEYLKDANKKHLGKYRFRQV